MLKIRPFSPADWDIMWQFIEPVFRAGETFPYSPQITQAEAFQAWITLPTATYVATQTSTGDILGTYYIKPNQPTLGAHVCNCGYIVAPSARRQGIATAMGKHSQREATRLGFRAMQYNLVVSTNHPSLQLWKKLGFEVIGQLPGAFKHPRSGYIDAYIMYKELGHPPPQTT